VLYDGEVCLGGGVISAAEEPPVVEARPLPVRRRARGQSAKASITASA